MQSATKRAALLEGMRLCQQTKGLSVLQHGEMVRDYYQDLSAHIIDGKPLAYQWRLPEWIREDLLWRGLPSDEVMAEYHLFHDCGKPLCRIVGDDGRQHFPDHAAVSKAAWLASEGDPTIGELIGMDMDLHLLSGEGVEAFARRPRARALLLTALAEVHANASMFGGIESTSFKIKWKHVSKRGRQVLAVIKQEEKAPITA